MLRKTPVALGTGRGEQMLASCVGYPVRFSLDAPPITPH